MLIGCFFQVGFMHNRFILLSTAHCTACHIIYCLTYNVYNASYEEVLICGGAASEDLTLFLIGMTFDLGDLIEMISGFLTHFSDDLIGMILGFSIHFSGITVDSGKVIGTIIRKEVQCKNLQNHKP